MGECSPERVRKKEVGGHWSPFLGDIAGPGHARLRDTSLRLRAEMPPPTLSSWTRGSRKGGKVGIGGPSMGGTRPGRPRSSPRAEGNSRALAARLPGKAPEGRVLVREGPRGSECWWARDSELHPPRVSGTSLYSNQWRRRLGTGAGSVCKLSISCRFTCKQPGAHPKGQAGFLRRLLRTPQDQPRRFLSSDPPVINSRKWSVLPSLHLVYWGPPHGGCLYVPPLLGIPKPLLWLRFLGPQTAEPQYSFCEMLCSPWIQGLYLKISSDSILPPLRKMSNSVRCWMEVIIKSRTWNGDVCVSWPQNTLAQA